MQALQSSQRFVEDSKEFIQKYRDRMVWHVVSFLAMVLLFRFLRRGLTPSAVERLGGSSALFILDRLFATAFLLALIAIPLFYRGATAAILRVAFLPTVIPVIRLLPRLLPRIFRRWVYMLVAMYLLDFFRYLLPADWFLTRLLLLMIATGGCVGLGYFLRSQRGQLWAASTGQRIVLYALRVVVVSIRRLGCQQLRRQHDPRRNSRRYAHP